MIKKLIGFTWLIFKTFVLRIGIAYFIKNLIYPKSLGTLIFIVYLLYFIGGLCFGVYWPKKKEKF